MSVKQTHEQDVPPALTIYFAERASKAASLSDAGGVSDNYAPAVGEAEKAAVVNLKDLDFGRIWEKVKMMTGAKEVAASEKEGEEAKRLEGMRVRSGEDRERNAKIRQARKDQERMLQEARGEVERLRQI